MRKFLQRLVVVIAFLPALTAWLFLGWVQWLITGRYPECWADYFVNWAKYDDFTDIPF